MDANEELYKLDNHDFHMLSGPPNCNECTTVHLETQLKYLASK